MSAPAAGTGVHKPALGVAWMLTAAFFFAGSIAFVRYLSDTYSTYEIVLIRQILGLLFMAPTIWSAGLGLLPERQLWMHVLRATLIYAAMWASYHSVTLISLADSMALQFTLPIWLGVFAVLFLGERPRWHRWLAVATGFIGALVIIRPGFAAFSLGMLVALAAAALYGAGDATSRYLARTHGTTALMFYGYVFQFPISVGLAAPVWTTPPLSEWPLLFAFGVVAFAAQWSLTRAYGVAEATLVGPVLFVRLPFVAALGYVLFGQVTDPWTWIGAALIFAGTTYSTRREMREARAAKRI